MLYDWMLICYYCCFRSIIPEMYNGATGLLKEELATVEFVAMTTDEWTSRSTKQYMAVTLHWLTEAMDIKSQKRYLCVPATSTPSERCFSTAGELVSQRRSNLSDQNIKMILFLNKNLRHKLEKKWFCFGVTIDSIYAVNQISKVILLCCCYAVIDLLFICYWFFHVVWYFEYNKCHLYLNL